MVKPRKTQPKGDILEMLKYTQSYINQEEKEFKFSIKDNVGNKKSVSIKAVNQATALKLLSRHFWRYNKVEQDEQPKTDFSSNRGIGKSQIEKKINELRKRLNR